MEDLKRGYCFEDTAGTRFLIVGDAINHKDGQLVYLCQELTGNYRLMIWTAQEISGKEAVDSAFGNPADRSVSQQITEAYPAGRYLVREDPAAVPERADTEEQMQSLLIRFLETSSCSEKLELLGIMKGKVTESMLESMAISMDYELGGGSVEEKYYALERFLRTRNRYEGTRLR